MKGNFMSRKDYVKFAAVIKQLPFKPDREIAAEVCVEVFLADSPAFDVRRFLEACGLPV